MVKRISLLAPFVCASLLLLGYLILMPTATLYAAPQATEWNVDRQDDPALPTATACTGADNDCSLRGAIDQAASGDTIVLAEAGTIQLSLVITLTKNLTITSASAATHSIDGNDSTRIFLIDPDKTIILNELTLQNGYAVGTSGDGGAIKMGQGTLTMTHVILQNNQSDDVGGALSVNPADGTGNVFLTNVTFRGNHAFYTFQSGGAIHAFARSGRTVNLSITQGLFENNIGGVLDEDEYEGYGGAISASTLDDNSLLNLEIRNTDFISNASGYAGAIYLYSYARGDNSSLANGLIYDSTFARNVGDNGGGIYVGARDGGYTTSLVISNTTFVSNTAQNGGAVYQFTYNGGENNHTRSNTKIYDSTFTQNSADARDGGAIYNSVLSFGGALSSLASMELVNTTLSGNRAGNDGGALFASSSGITNTASIITATHVTFVDNHSAGAYQITLFEGQFTENHLYLKNSVIDKGTNEVCSLNGASVDGVNNLIMDTTCGSSSPFRLGSPTGINATLADNGGPTLTHALYAGSSALNAVPAGQCTVGDSAVAVTTDQRGLARPFGAACDIGAFEAQSNSLPTQPPVTGLSATNDGPTVVNDPTLLTASITGGEDVAVDWDFGDESIGTGMMTTHIYTQVGIYTATVVAANASNSLTATTTVYVGDAVVEVNSNAFSPKQVTIPISGTVVWVLRGGNHSVTADDGSFEQPAGTDWPPFVHTFGGDATVPYYCSIHGAPGGAGMAGSVIVGDGVPDEEPGEVPDGLRLPSVIKQEE